MGKDLKIGVPRNSSLQLQDPGEKGKMVLPNGTGANKNKLHELDLKKDCGLENRQMDLENSKPNDGLDKEVVDLICVIANNDPQKKSTPFKIPSGLPEAPKTKDKSMCDTKRKPSFELSLKRLRDIGDTDTNPHDQFTVKHSKLSAFSRYQEISTP